jgi:hypothetical protein
VDFWDKPGHDEIESLEDNSYLHVGSRLPRSSSEQASLMEQAMPTLVEPTLIDTAPGSNFALWLGRIFNGLAILFPQFTQILFGLYLGLMMWGGPWLNNRGLRP